MTNDDSPPAERLRAAVEETYGPLTEAYERLEDQVRPSATGVRPVGWTPYVDVLRAFRERRVVGDWDELARLLVDPASLDTSSVKLIEVTRDAAEAAHEIVKPLLSRGERVLLLAPTADDVEQITGGFADDHATFVVQLDTVAVPEPQGSTGTLPLTPATEENLADTTGTRPLLPVDDVPSGEPPAPETTVRAATIRPVGEAWRQAWQTEVRFLRRGLVWMEQWPRDAAALESLRTEDRRRRAETDARRTDLSSRIDELRTAVGAAEQAVTEADREDERLAAELDRITAELAEPRAEAQRLQAAADAAASEANRLSEAADAAQARCAQIDARLAHARTELQAAREQETTLAGQLEKARQDLPVATAEAERLQAASADAAAVAHAAYYRAVSAESALSARRRTMTLGQRLHVAAPPPDLRDLRAEAKARKREADDAALRAAEAKQAAEQAELRRSGLIRFVNEGGAGLTAARQAQQSFDAEIIRLTAERETAAGEYRERAREAAEAVDRATQASGAARHAHQTVRLIEERLAAARTARQEAQAAGERSRTLAATAAQRLAEAEAELADLESATEQEQATRSAELASAEETARRTRENVQDFCGTDPADATPGQLETHQRRAMERIEQLTGYLEAGAHDASGETADILLRTADLVCATPLAAAAAPLPPSAEYDTLIVTGAEAITDAQFLVGAVRTRNWILLGDPTRPPEHTDDPTLPGTPFTRSAEQAPHKLHRRPTPAPITPPETPSPAAATMPVPTVNTPADPEPTPTSADATEATPTDDLPPSATPTTDPPAVPTPEAEPAAKDEPQPTSDVEAATEQATAPADATMPLPTSTPAEAEPTPDAGATAQVEPAPAEATMAMPTLADDLPPDTTRADVTMSAPAPQPSAEVDPAAAQADDDAEPPVAADITTPVADPEDEADARPAGDTRPLGEHGSVVDEQGEQAADRDVQR
ncbi:hypothetical protein ABZ801_00340 [Actinomadura sp. NPDC047616]|uniref:hypothetical protein n=1 Tax=Actinomadura sp. NPDC047616 TaxID=3155914 RepID=UPI0033EF82D3